MIPKPLRQFAHHPRHWRNNFYVYPVISRRSGGLSIGVNLNPDAACNFDCIYCQVDRTGVPRTREVDPEQLRAELREMIALAQDGSLFGDSEFRDVPDEMRRICDIALSGDGEPTTCKQFRICIEIIADLKRQAGLNETKIVLITDSCYLTKPEVAAGLAILDSNNGQVWAKLDAGTEEYYQEVNRPNVPLRHVMDQIIATARVRPVVIQSLFMRVHGRPPISGELEAYIGRLLEIQSAGGRIESVQVYTIARPPAQAYVSALSDAEVDAMANRIRERTGLRAHAYYGGGPV